MTCIMQLRFAGVLDRDAFSASFRDALQQHPLLSAVVDQSKRRRPHWIPDSGSACEIEWVDSSSGDKSALAQRIDLTVRPGLRFQVRTRSNQAIVTMVFHHACCDGIGAARFLEDMLVTYHRRVGGESPPTTPTAAHAERLLHRGGIPQVGRLPARLSHEVRTFLREGRHWLLHSATPLGLPAQTEAVNESAGDFVSIPTRTFDETSSAHLRGTARQRKVTVNDMLLAALFLTLARWNTAHIPERRTRWLRVAVPQNLRADADRWMPAANKVTMCFLTREYGACYDPSALLHGIQREMAAARYWFRGKSLLRAMRLLQAVRGLERYALAADRCLATAVLSNIGDYDRWFCGVLPRDGSFVRAGGLRLESIVVIPPVRPTTHIAFCASSYAGVLSIGMRYNRHRLDRQRADELLALYVSQIRALIGEHTKGTVPSSQP